MSAIHVVTVLAPREPIDGAPAPTWQEYLPLLRLQRDSARWYGHKHSVVTDADLGAEFDLFRTHLDVDLMRAMIAGVIAKLQAGGSSHLVFLDVDCLIARNLEPVFTENLWDIGLTHRENEVSPINNGAMYVRAEAIPQAIAFFKRAWALCGTHWGADQEAISKAAHPVPKDDCVIARNGMRIGFLNMKRYAAVPKNHLSKHGGETYVVHFKGKTKEWMADYANAFIFSGERHGAG